MSVIYNQISSTSLEVIIPNKSSFQAIEKIIFASNLLHSLKPDPAGVWKLTSEPRINASIKGFTKDITWSNPKKNVLLGDFENPIKPEWVALLKDTIHNFLNPQKSAFTVPIYKFEIIDHNEDTVYPYRFSGRGREIIALCVLWDGLAHPRDHLEVSLDNGRRTYGDPSKTVDTLRNQGFPRETDQSLSGVYIHVSRSTSNGGKQEHYQLLNKNQSTADIVGRSNIPPRFRKALYEHKQFTCQNCGNVYEPQYLSPDHRVPSIVEHDALSEENYLEKLQTLCVRCNQVKREACKKCPYNKQCETCEWAYPERNSVSIQNMRLIKETAKKLNMLPNELVTKLWQNLK